MTGRTANSGRNPGAVFLLALLFVLAGGWMAGPAQSTELSKSIARIKKSIVGIATCQLTRRPPIALRGTGFAVADGLHVVTNFHVVNTKLDAANKEFLCLVFGTGKRPQIEPAEIVARDEAHDVAVLKFSGTPFPPATLAPQLEIEDGHPIAFTGFPIGMALGLYPVTHRGIVSARTPIAIPQYDQRRLNPKMVRRLRNLFNVLQLDATAYPGNSGSPLYCQHDGRVVGIVSSVFVKKFKENVLTNPSGITYAVPISHARKLLRRIGL